MLNNLDYYINTTCNTSLAVDIVSKTNNSRMLGVRFFVLIKFVFEASSVNGDHPFPRAGESCTPEGRVVCFSDCFQQCGSGF